MEPWKTGIVWAQIQTCCTTVWGDHIQTKVWCDSMSITVRVFMTYLNTNFVLCPYERCPVCLRLKCAAITSNISLDVSRFFQPVTQRQGILHVLSEEGTPITFIELHDFTELDTSPRVSWLATPTSGTIVPFNSQMENDLDRQFCFTHLTQFPPKRALDNRQHTRRC